jgi:hypothetical protein
MKQNTVELMNILSQCSKSKTNKDLAVLAGVGIIVVSGICLYYYSRYHNLSQLYQKHTGRISVMSNQISSLNERNSSLQNQLNKLHQKNNDLTVSLKKCESTVSNKDDKDCS